MKAKPSIAEYLKSKRKFYQEGGVKEFFSSGKATSAGNLGSSLVNLFDPQDEYGVQSSGGAFASGALSGAAAGAALGPIGAGVGALVGGVTSLFGNDAAEEAAKKAKERKKQLDQAKAYQESQNILSNYDNMGTGMKSLAHGGTVYSWPGGYQIKPLKFKPTDLTFTKEPGLKFQQGGEIPAGNGTLKPIGDSDSFEVKGNDPAATDDVLIQDAAVDHNEVVKPSQEGLRIFSDTLMPPGSKLSFSKLAKKLEKQKTYDEQRFPDQNKLIEAKLENLFQTQQAMNGDNMGETPQEAMQPAGETPGAGFESGNMFRGGGNYHPITPAGFGSLAPIGFGSAVMANLKVNLSNDSAYRDLIGNNRRGLKFNQGGLIFKKTKKAKTPTDGTTFDYTKMTPPSGPGYSNYKKGGVYQLGGIDFSQFQKEYPQGLDSTQQALGMQAGLVKGTGSYSADQLPEGIRSVLADVDPVTGKPRRILKGIGYTDYDTHLNGLPESNKTGTGDLNTHVGSSRHATGALAESLATADPFPQFPGRRITQYYYDNPAITPAPVVPVKPTPSMISYTPKTGKLKPVNHKPMGFNYKKNKPAAGSITRGYQYGGFDPYKLRPDYHKLINPTSKYFNPDQAMIEGKIAADNASIKEIQSQLPKKKKFDLSNGLSTAATLVPSFANLLAAKQLPEVPEVYLNKPVSLKRADYADQQNLLQQGLRTASLAARQNSVNPNAQQAGIGNAQAQFNTATNSMFGDINRQNTTISNQQAMINAQIAGQNNQLLGQRSAAENARSANILGLQSQARADLSNKTLGLTQQANQKQLDKQKYAMFMAWLNKQGVGLGDRNQFLDAAGYSKEGNRMGGVIRSNRKLMRKPY